MNCRMDQKSPLFDLLMRFCHQPTLLICRNETIMVKVPQNLNAPKERKENYNFIKCDENKNFAKDDILFVNYVAN